MAIIVEVVISGLTPDGYDALRAEVGWVDSSPVGGFVHLTWFEGDACHNVDAWEDEAAFARFGDDRLGPALAKLGLEVEINPTFHPAHEVLAPEAVAIV